MCMGPVGIGEEEENVTHIGVRRYDGVAVVTVVFSQQILLRRILLQICIGSLSQPTAQSPVPGLGDMEEVQLLVLILVVQLENTGNSGDFRDDLITVRFLQP